MTYIIQNISPFPPAPDSVNDTPQNFSIKADTFVAHQKDTFVGEANTLKDQMNTLAGEVDGRANDADQSAQDSEASAIASAGSANFKGTWNSGTSYTVPSSVYLNGLYYNAILGSTNQNPETEFTYWVEQALDLAPAMSYGNLSNPLLDLPLNNSLAMKQGVGAVTFARSTTGTYIDRYGVLQYASIDEPRFEKDGLLIEGASTNNILDSQNFDTATTAWNTNGATVTANATVAPDGTTTAGSILDIGNGILQQTTSITLGETYTTSAFVKAGTTDKFVITLTSLSWDTLNVSITYDLTLGIVESIVNEQGATYGIIPLTDGWYRVWITKTVNTASATSTNTRFISNNDGTLYIWGVQQEALPFASNYIPTTTTAVTRNADDCIVTSGGNIPYPTHALAISVDFNTYVGVSDVNRNIFRISGFNFMAARVADATSNIETIYSAANRSLELALADSNVRRLTYNVDGLGSQTYYINGVLGGSYQDTLSSEAIPTEIQLGRGSSVGVSMLYGHIKNFRIWDKALTPLEAKIA